MSPTVAHPFIKRLFCVEVVSYFTAPICPVSGYKCPTGEEAGEGALTGG